MLTIEDKLLIFEESGEHFIDLMERAEPHRTNTARNLIRQNMMKVRHDLHATGNEGLRLNYGERGWSRRSLTGNRPATYVRRVKQWLKNAALNLGCAVLICTAVVSLSLFVGG